MKEELKKEKELCSLLQHQQQQRHQRLSTTTGTGTGISISNTRISTKPINREIISSSMKSMNPSTNKEIGLDNHYEDEYHMEIFDEHEVELLSQGKRVSYYDKQKPMMMMKKKKTKLNDNIINNVSSGIHHPSTVTAITTNAATPSSQSLSQQPLQPTTQSQLSSRIRSNPLTGVVEMWYTDDIFIKDVHSQLLTTSQLSSPSQPSKMKSKPPISPSGCTKYTAATITTQSPSSISSSTASSHIILVSQANQGKEEGQ